MNEDARLERALGRFNFTTGQRLALLCSNYIPILHVLIIFCHDVVVPCTPIM